MLIVNKISHKSYETIIRPSDIMNNIFNIESIHKIIIKSLNTDKNTDYTFNINFSGDSLKLSFNALLDEYLKINFDICLTEKKISSDDELSINFNKMNIKLKELEKIITEQRNLFEYKFTQQEKQIINLENNLSNCVVNLVHHNAQLPVGYNSVVSQAGGQFFKLLVPINLTELDMSKMIIGVYTVDYEKIDCLYKLKKLKLSFYSTDNSNIRYNFSTSLAKSKTVEHLIIMGHDSGGSAFDSTINTSDFTGLEHFPNLKHLCVESSRFNSSSFVGNLKSFKHNIKKIEMISCTDHNNSELENYCRNNKIEILIK
jgi:hypothetical protein